MGVNIAKVAKKAAHYPYVLMVMRHAKAEVMSSGGDRERELTEKGRKQAKKVAKGIIEMDLVPDAISCSGATRAQQTLERMLKQFGDKPKVNYRQSLYEGGIGALMDEITQTKSSDRILMIVGHEPRFLWHVNGLPSEESEPTKLDLLNLGLSTASVVIFGSETPFNRWTTHDGEVLAVINPKDFD
ncbi:putative phosphoglycerate mutase family protein [Bifidobacterium tsurumiense]|uniref:Putative phosphoglycerate mutase family protein n=1 Tax=Bifidobacterium tsurumiense TaxID=356829 RepID=A0A087EEA4_9BIFI|nr:histidine phosphatase family protein [Bifidobacterium tsurumiense]KFJ06105.1 putative phosphoglycerate mutase family protein [Bifidobacterium tsurumiense]